VSDPQQVPKGRAGVLAIINAKLDEAAREKRHADLTIRIVFRDGVPTHASANREDKWKLD